MMEFRPSLPRKVAGWSLLFLGAIGTVLPFLQGFLFLALGLFVLRHQYIWAHRGMGWMEGRWPGAVSRVEAMEGRLIARSRTASQRFRERTTRILNRR
jgi:hypothetical protein